MKEVGFLGHVISGEGIVVDLSKVQSVTEWIAPTSVSEICSFLGLAGYYRRFIENFSKTAKPMIELLKKDTKFKWTEDCEASFQELKKRMTTVPLLTLPDIHKDFQVYCDASRRTWICAYAGRKSFFICLATTKTSRVELCHT